MKVTSNPLLQLSPLKNRALPFDQIKNEHFLPALQKAIEDAKKKLEALKADKETYFQNTIEALETLGEDITLISSTFYNFNSANTNKELQKIALEFGPQLSAYSNDITLDEKIFEKVKQVYETRHGEGLSGEDLKLTEEVYKNFVRNGALLKEQEKHRLRQIDQRLSQLSPQFSENLLKATSSFELLITDPEDLAGLPESLKDSAKNEALAKGHSKAWLFNLQYPSYIPFLKYSEKRELREKMYRASSSRAFGDSFDNQKIILETLQLREERAQLLGFKNHAAFVLSRRMAQSIEKVNDFINKLLSYAKPAAEKELQELQEFVTHSLNGPNPLMPWDFSFYAEKLKQKKFDFSEEELKPYFALDAVIDGVFAVAKKLYGLNFSQNHKYPKYHKDVRTYEVTDNENNLIGLFYADFFPRDSKNGGAWMTNYYEQGLFKGEVMRPHISIVCNFTKPTPERPSLLTLNEVQTLFHEFGHALHGLLSQCKYRSLGGTNVYWDFVELPSQILENWSTHKEGLRLFAKHYQTGEDMPEALIEKIKKSSQFMAGQGNLRQLDLAILDMKWHTTDTSTVSEVESFEKQARKPQEIIPPVEGTNLSCGFAHIFAGGYSAGYYSYKWAEVLDADAFEKFEQEGIFNVETAKSFRKNILERGGTEHPMELYKRFRGQEPSVKALLKREGLVSD